MPRRRILQDIAGNEKGGVAATAAHLGYGGPAGDGGTGRSRKRLCMSTNPDEDIVYLEKPDTAFLSKARISAWEAGKTFSTDWAANHFFAWAELLHPLAQQTVRILEIGSWEGRSALFFLNYLPLGRITCIDTFSGNVEHHLDPHFAALAPKAEAQFEANLAEFADRIEKIKGSSATVLPQLAIAGRRFDLAYIDASHLAADVYRDAALTWPLMAPGGLMLFDDYEWDGMDGERERPKLGVDAFLAAIAAGYREVHRGYQIAIAKL
jgi:predicted O-methyltransferase YrrM